MTFFHAKERQQAADSRQQAAGSREMLVFVGSVDKNIEASIYIIDRNQVLGIQASSV